MTRNRIALAATSGLAGLTMFAASAAFAEGNPSPEMLQEFLTANPDAVAAVATVEAQTGGTVVAAEIDDEGGATGVIEFMVSMSDGSTSDMLYNPADGTMTDETANRDGEHEFVGANDTGEDESGTDSDDEEDGDEADEENEADDDK